MKSGFTSRIVFSTAFKFLISSKKFSVFSTLLASKFEGLPINPFDKPTTFA